MGIIFGSQKKLKEIDGGGGAVKACRFGPEFFGEILYKGRALIQNEAIIQGPNQTKKHQLHSFFKIFHFSNEI